MAERADDEPEIVEIVKILSEDEIVKVLSEDEIVKILSEDEIVNPNQMIVR